MGDKISGGGLCGEVRYETTREPVLQLLCYCTDCQTVSGAAGYAVYGVPIDRIVLTKGTPGQNAVSIEVVLAFRGMGEGLLKIEHLRGWATARFSPRSANFRETRKFNSTLLEGAQL